MNMICLGDPMIGKRQQWVSTLLCVGMRRYPCVNTEIHCYHVVFTVLVILLKFYVYFFLRRFLVFSMKNLFNS